MPVTAHEPEKRRAGAISPDPAEMHVVYCPNCSRAVGETKLLPGTLCRYRCKRCGEWTWVVGVAATTAAAAVVAEATA